MAQETAESTLRLAVAKTKKLYIGGEFPRSESGRSFPLTAKQTGKFYANIAHASRKDARNAVEVARKAFSSWSRKTAFNRGQILYRMAEMLEARSAEISSELSVVSGVTPAAAKREVEASIDRLVWYSGWCDKFQQLSNINLYIIKSAKGFEKFLLTEKNIDMDRIGESDHGTRLGYLFGVEAATVCPETLARVTSETESAQSTVAGRVTETQTSGYTRLTVEDMAGRTTTLYWIFNFDNSNLLLKGLTDKTARYEFSFSEKEVFFLARKEYQKVKVITGLKKI